LPGIERCSKRRDERDNQDLQTHTLREIKAGGFEKSLPAMSTTAVETTQSGVGEIPFQIADKRKAFGRACGFPQGKHIRLPRCTEKQDRIDKIVNALGKV
jgi:hypothetical protein